MVPWGAAPPGGLAATRKMVGLPVPGCGSAVRGDAAAAAAAAAG